MGYGKVCLAVAMAAIVSTARAATLQGIGDLPGWYEWSAAHAVSGNGLAVAGQSVADVGYRAVHWEAGTLTNLGTIPVPYGTSVANGISHNGSVIVGSSVWESAFGSSKAIRWTMGPGGAIREELPWLPPGGLTHPEAVANDTSADGSIIIGNSRSPDLLSSTYYQAVRWQSAAGVWTPQSLGFLHNAGTGSMATAVSPDGSVVVGMANIDMTARGTEAFRWTPATGMQGLGFIAPFVFNGIPYEDSRANDVSADGLVVVGVSSNANGNQEAFRWKDDGNPATNDMIGLGFPKANAVSGNGSVIVGAHSNGNPAIWTPSTGVLDLIDVLTAQGVVLPTGWSFTEAADISADGLTIIGNSSRPGSIPEGWIARLDDYAASLVTGSPVKLSQTVDASGQFQLEFDYRFESLDNSGALTVELDGVEIVGPLSPSAGWHTVSVPLSGTYNNATLEFILDGSAGERVLLDNVVFPGIENGNFLMAGLNGWSATVSPGGGVGVQAVPEPSALLLAVLAMLGMAWLRRLRRSTSASSLPLAR